LSYFKHDSAIVDEGAVIGQGTSIWHWVHVCSGALIGDNCSLGQNVYVGNRVIIGNRVKVQNGVSVYDGVTLEDEVFCGPGVVFTNVFNPRSAINRKEEYRATIIKKGASLGANCTLVCGVTIGLYAFIGAGAVVTKDVPAFALMVGVPAKQIGWISRFGENTLLPVEGIGEYKCPHSNDIYLLNDSVLTINFELD
jgi:UDP-2-acetamido-3-amino-2,3-dideoxy-glucuronate N-acetyltransferase